MKELMLSIDLEWRQHFLESGEPRAVRAGRGSLHYVRDSTYACIAPYSTGNVLTPPATALIALTALWSNTALPLERGPLYLFVLVYVAVALCGISGSETLHRETER